MLCISGGVRRFGWAYRLHLQQGRRVSEARNQRTRLLLLDFFSLTPKTEGDMLIRNVELSPNYTALQLRSLYFSHSLPCSRNPAPTHYSKPIQLSHPTSSTSISILSFHVCLRLQSYSFPLCSSYRKAAKGLRSEVKLSLNGPWRSDVEAPTFSRRSAHRWR
jgi:hypothetical protein